MTLFDPPLTRNADPQTSKEAAESMQPALSRQRFDVLCEIAAAHSYGRTAYEIADFLGHQQSVMARRCTDLAILGLVEDSGKIRLGSTGRKLTVWVITEKGRKAL